MRTWIVLTGLLLNTLAAAEGDSLYSRLGGAATVDRITGHLLDRVYADERIAFLFADADRADLHSKINDQICMEAGGGCSYDGLDMVEAHSGFDIKYAEYDAFVEDFIAALEDAKVPFRLQNELLAIFAPMREDVTHQ